jgi:hypothetical protein
VSAAEINPDLRRFLFRLVDFFVRIWEVKALLLLIFPEPVALNLLAAPLFVFILGMFFTPYPAEKSALLKFIRYSLKSDYSNSQLS